MNILEELLKKKPINLHNFKAFFWRKKTVITVTVLRNTVIWLKIKALKKQPLQYQYNKKDNVQLNRESQLLSFTVIICGGQG